MAAVGFVSVLQARQSQEQVQAEAVPEIRVLRESMPADPLWWW